MRSSLRTVCPIGNFNRFLNLPESILKENAENRFMKNCSLHIKTSMIYWFWWKWMNLERQTRDECCFCVNWINSQEKRCWLVSFGTQVRETMAATNNGHLPNMEDGEDKPMLIVKKPGDGPGITALINRQIQGNFGIFTREKFRLDQ